VVDFVSHLICRQSAIEQKRLAEIGRANKQRDLAEKLSGAGIPPRGKGASVASVGENYREAVLGYCQSLKNRLERGAGVFMFGGKGTGKTTAAYAILNYAAAGGYSVAYTTALGLINAYKAAGYEGHDGFIKKAAEPDFMVIDELDKAHGSPHDIVILGEIIDVRYRQQKPIISCVNKAFNVVEQMIGEYAFDRITGDGVMLLEFNGDSYR